MSLQTNQLANLDINDMDDIPDSYLCPINHVLMEFPVLAEDGNTYEKSAIEQWIRTKPISPMDNRTPLSLDRLVPNRALKDAIDIIRKNFENLVVERSKSVLEESTKHLIPSINFTTRHFQSKKDDNITNLMVTIKASDPLTRPPAHICCTIDTSGSMGRDATIKNESGMTENDGLSLLDIVKHGVRTIIENLGENDYISIISYSNNAKIVVDTMKMTKENKKIATDKLNMLHPDYQTNFWDGLSKSLKCIEKAQHLVKNSSVFILTDGQPNIIPPKGNINTFKKYLDKHNIKCSVNTYGFGFYDIDSTELNEISNLGNGTYNYISDSSMLGTTFVNTLSNTLTSFESNMILKVILPEGIIFEDGGYQNNFDMKTNEWEYENIKLGSFHYGQEKNIILTFNRDTSREQNIELYLEMNDIDYYASLSHKISNEPVVYDENVVNKFIIQRMRFSLLNSIKNIIDTYKHYKSIDHIFTISNSWRLSSPKIEKLIERSQISRFDEIKKYASDINSDFIQVKEAIQIGSDNFKKWGYHYLLSLYGAHLMEECNNFKDPGVQYYGGAQFGEIRDNADEIFCNLPAPEPSNRPNYGTGYRGGGGGATRGSNRIDMSSYHNISNGCFKGSCLVELQDGSKKQIKDIKKGDILKRMDDYNNVRFSKVRCLVKSKCLDDKCKMVYFESDEGGLWITEYHPMLQNQNWIFPCSIKRGEDIQAEYVYNLVLEDNYGHGDHIVGIGGFNCVTLGHHYEHPVVKHDYFGSQKVIDDLQMFQGFSDGMVVIQYEDIVRGEDKRICGIKPFTQANKKNISKYTEEEHVRNNIEFNGVGALFAQ